MLDKSHYSYLIAFERQLSKALDTDDVDMANVLQSLAVCLELLHANFGEDDGGSTRELPPGVEDPDAPGDDTPLGAALARIAELERAAASVVGAQQLRSCGRGPAVAEAGELGLGRKRRKPSVLKGARRGKK